MTKIINGRVSYQSFEGGFWGIIAKDGQKWMILNMPEQLKFNNKAVEVTIEPIDAMSMVMWGTPARITAFETT